MNQDLGRSIHCIWLCFSDLLYPNHNCPLLFTFWHNFTLSTLLVFYVFIRTKLCYDFLWNMYQIFFIPLHQLSKHFGIFFMYRTYAGYCGRYNGYFDMYWLTRSEHSSGRDRCILKQHKVDCLSSSGSCLDGFPFFPPENAACGIFLMYHFNHVLIRSPWLFYAAFGLSVFPLRLPSSSGNQSKFVLSCSIFILQQDYKHLESRNHVIFFFFSV